MADDSFDHLDGTGRAAAAIASRPQRIVYPVIAIAVAISWAVLAAMAAGMLPLGPAVSGPGGMLLDLLPDVALPDLAMRFLALCLGAAPAGPGGIAQFAALTTMWFLMSVAMMLPSAAPMIRTYCEIADTARAKREAVVHPLVLVAGYLAVWFAASLGFAATTLVVGMAAGRALPAPVTGIAAAAALGLAGLYQFSGLKEACLKKCRRPFSILFARWSTRPAKVFRLGLEQGVWCVGCCWALMLVMFAIGLMNLFWMALIGLFTVVEKQLTGRLTTRLAGAILLVWAAALLVVSW